MEFAFLLHCPLSSRVTQLSLSTNYWPEKYGATWNSGLVHTPDFVWSSGVLLPRAKGNTVRLNTAHRASKPEVTWEQFWFYRGRKQIALEAGK